MGLRRRLSRVNHRPSIRCRRCHTTSYSWCGAWYERRPIGKPSYTHTHEMWVISYPNTRSPPNHVWVMRARCTYIFAVYPVTTGRRVRAPYIRTYDVCICIRMCTYDARVQNVRLHTLVCVDNVAVTTYRSRLRPVHLLLRFTLVRKLTRP